MTPLEGSVFVAVAAAHFALGLAALISRRHLIKIVIGLELLGNGVSLLFILGGYRAGDVALSQAVVFTIIAIEAVVAGVALALVVLLARSGVAIDSLAVARLARGGDR
ncbi:MAG: NADH-quinone oxidoreductase subunit K [Methanospirillum sp.]|nr:NADH-quinone oxidoreductase subunit K [Methanospirillum sp.]